MEERANYQQILFEQNEELVKYTSALLESNKNNVGSMKEQVNFLFYLLLYFFPINTIPFYMLYYIVLHYTSLYYRCNVCNVNVLNCIKIEKL